MTTVNSYKNRSMKIQVLFFVYVAVLFQFYALRCHSSSRKQAVHDKILDTMINRLPVQ